MRVGHIYRILAPADCSTTPGAAFLIVELFNVADSVDVRLNMPILLRHSEALIISAKVWCFCFLFDFFYLLPLASYRTCFFGSMSSMTAIMVNVPYQRVPILLSNKNDKILLAVSRLSHIPTMIVTLSICMQYITPLWFAKHCQDT